MTDKERKNGTICTWRLASKSRTRVEVGMSRPRLALPTVHRGHDRAGSAQSQASAKRQWRSGVVRNGRHGPQRPVPTRQLTWICIRVACGSGSVAARVQELQETMPWLTATTIPHPTSHPPSRTMSENTTQAQRPDGHGSRTMTVTPTGTAEASAAASPAETRPVSPSEVGVLRLRGGPVRQNRVVWSEGTIDNEGMGKKKSKSESGCVGAAKLRAGAAGLRGLDGACVEGWARGAARLGWRRASWLARLSGLVVVVMSRRLLRSRRPSRKGHQSLPLGVETICAELSLAGTPWSSG